MFKLKLKAVFTSILFLILLSSWNNNSNYTSLDAAVKEFADDKSLQSANWGLSVYSVETQRELFSYNSNKSLTPASTLKAVTSSTALIMLGQEYRYETQLMHDGFINNEGTLNGNLYVIGSGDPSFGASQMHDSLSLENVLKHFLESLKSLGIKKINGSIITDTRIFDTELASPKWLWEDIGNYFGAGTCGLSVNENEYSVFFRSGNFVGDTVAVLYTEPEIPGMILYNAVTTAESSTGDNVYIYGVPYSNERWLTGTIPLGATEFEVRGSMPDPAKFFSIKFLDFLNSENIAINGDAEVVYKNSKRQLDISELTYISSCFSPPLKDIAERTNMKSINSYAESLLKTIGFITSEEGSASSGIKAITDLWETKGVDMCGVKLYDGCGLATVNKITPQALAHILAIVANEPIYDAFSNGLPVAGQSGSLKSGFTGTASENILKAKSGFLSNVRAFAGYTITQNNKLVSFSLIVNDYEGSFFTMRKKMNELMNEITKSSL
ncbi:MAG: D-alanyl-D-alanine carboxypeptidase/D-alanyl-D-alanine-endopeptidase [Bacteroidales bacterium]